MRFSNLSVLLGVVGSTSAITIKASTVSTSAAPSATNACPLDNCLFKERLGQREQSVASSFCSTFLSTTVGTVTVTAAQSTFATVINTVPAPSATVITTQTVTATAGQVCTATITGAASFSTFVSYATRAAAPSQKAKRNDDVPDFFTSGCKTKCKNPKAKISSACSCLLTSATVTVTKPTTLFATATFVPPTQTVLATAVSTVTVTACTATVTTNVAGSAPTAFSCGTTFTVAPTASASGTKTCANSIAAPSQNVLFRIEGNDSEGTIFEDCQVSGPRTITTPSGGSHLCDGTNDNANPNPGTTPTDLIDAAGRAHAFGFDGTYSNQFQDYFITSIGATAQTSTQFWGILVNGQFTPTGGCQFETFNGDRTLWAFDAFNKNAFLKVEPDYAVAKAGSGSVAVRVTDDQTGNAISGASFAGATSDSNGMISIPVPTVPGCYQFKATRSDALRSNAFYLTVVGEFA